MKFRISIKQKSASAISIPIIHIAHTPRFDNAHRAIKTIEMLKNMLKVLGTYVKTCAQCLKIGQNSSDRIIYNTKVNPIIVEDLSLYYT